MKPVVSDPSAFEYSVLITVPFLNKEEVECDLSKDYQSKTVLREDLQKIVDDQWNQVGEISV